LRDTTSPPNYPPHAATLVEPTIALSIVGAAVLALRRQNGVHRWWIAGVIGRVRGLGFASSLASLGLETRKHSVALLSFSLGIDAAQTAVVIVVMIHYCLVARIPRLVLHPLATQTSLFSVV
jgi:hypothetical protein